MLFTEIEQQSYPILLQVNKNWELILEIKTLFTDAIQDQDDDILNEAKEKSQAVIDGYKKIHKLNGKRISDLERIKAAFERYFTTASGITIKIIESGNQTDITKFNFKKMHNQFFEFKNLQQVFKEKVEASFASKLQKSRSQAVRSNQAGILIGLVLIILLVSVSMFITRIITRPLKHANYVAEGIMEGNWNVKIKDHLKNASQEKINHYNDEIGLLIHAFSLMRSKLHSNFIDLETARDGAFAGSKAKAAFLASMSHEIRTPMNGVLGMAQLLEYTELDEEQKDYLNTITSSGTLLLTIINEILDFSKLESGNVELEYIEFNLEYLIHEVESVVNVHTDNGVQTIINYPLDAPHSFIGDPTRIRQIVFNLLGNAIKFTERGYINVSVNCEPVDDSTSNITISVEDSGIGMSEEQQEKLFQAFSQADPSITRKYGGTGLGLAICQQLIKIMQGEIWVESEKGKGATFYVRLKLPVAKQITQINRDIDLSDTKILIVDDNVINRQILTSMLSHYHAEVTALSHPLEVIPELLTAVEFNSPYNIVILDFNMPGQNGMELGKNIRKNQQFDNISLVMLTSSGNIGDANNFEQAGFSAYLNKPIRSDTLEQVLKKLHQQQITSSKIITSHIVDTDSLTSKNTKEYTHYNVKVLLVEDNKMNQRVASKMLSIFAIHCDIAEDGLQAVEFCRHANYDLIFMDCNMPVMNGYAATEQIRNNEATRTTIIALTANAMNEDREKCIQAGMDDVLVKPLSLPDLEQTLKQWLS